MKISWIGPWVSRIDWWEGHWWGSTDIENWRSWKIKFFWIGHFEFLFSKNFFFCFISMKTSSPFIWGIIFFCTMVGFFRMCEKTSSELICTRLSVHWLSVFVKFLTGFGRIVNMEFSLLTGCRPLFCTSDCLSKLLNSILCDDLHQKGIGSLFFMQNRLFSKSWQNAQSKCKNWGTSTEFSCEIII